MSPALWLQVLGGLISLAVNLSAYLKDKKIVDGAQLDQITRQLKGARTSVDKANTARAASIANSAAPGHLRDHDADERPD